MKKLTIIIPIYNVERYLKRCLESCIEQTLDNLEVVIIDDYSTDGSFQIAQEYADKYPHLIRVFRQETNKGQGAARNRGIELAKGEYLLFLDSDDWIEENACELLWKAAKEQDADMAGGDWLYSTDNSDEIRRLHYLSSGFGKDNLEKLSIYTYKCGLFWTRIYRKNFLTKNHIKFLEGKIYEDSPFNFLTALYANKVIKLDLPFYHYYQRPGSSSHRRNDPRHYKDKLDVVEYIFCTCKERGLYEDYKSVIDDKWLSGIMTATRDCLIKFDKPVVKWIKHIKKLCKERQPQYRTTSIYYKVGPTGQRIIFDFAMWSPWLSSMIVPRVYRILRLFCKEI